MKTLSAAMTALAESGIPTDVQELLLRGDAARGISPGALRKALAASVLATVVTFDREAAKMTDVASKAQYEIDEAHALGSADAYRDCAYIIRKDFA